MIKTNKSLIHTGKIVLACLVLVILIGFVEKKHHTKSSLDMDISILNQNGNLFISREDIQELASGTQEIIGQNISEGELHEMEQRLLSHQYIEQAQVFKNLKGKLVVQVTQSTPIARLLRPQKPDAYISKEGNILATSEKFSARVPLVSGSYADQLIEEGRQVPNEAHQILTLLQFIDEDDFWKAQIAQLDIDETGKIVLYPQVGKQYIEFGNADDMSSKFQRLEVFYKKILPKEGWNKYTRVNVQYRDQIICE